jgi:hypothetical protein
MHVAYASHFPPRMVMPRVQTLVWNHNVSAGRRPLLPYDLEAFPTIFPALTDVSFGNATPEALLQLAPCSLTSLSLTHSKTAFVTDEILPRLHILAQIPCLTASATTPVLKLAEPSPPPNVCAAYAAADITFETIPAVTYQ